MPIHAPAARLMLMTALVDPVPDGSPVDAHATPRRG